MEDILKRPYIRARFDTLTEERIEEFLTSLAEIAVFIKNVPPAFSLPRDVDDEPYINLAIKSEADYIVTRDNDLLDLMTGFDDSSKEFRQKFRPLKTVNPLEFLKIVREKMEKDSSVEA